jgi:hypothetical protein
MTAAEQPPSMGWFAVGFVVLIGSWALPEPVELPTIAAVAAAMTVTAIRYLRWMAQVTR